MDLWTEEFRRTMLMVVPIGRTSCAILWETPRFCSTQLKVIGSVAALEDVPRAMKMAFFIS